MKRSHRSARREHAGFNTPFKGLRLRPEPSRRPVRPPREPPPTEPSDAELFRQAVAGVVPLEGRPQAPVVPPPEVKVIDEEAEALARLAELVSGQGPFDIADTDEFIEGGASGVDERVWAALRRGDYAVQGHIDLHGMSKAEAKEAVERFLAESQRERRRCVLVIHGRGLNSKDQIPVLKEQLQAWLQRGRIGRKVLAFATARPHDGGAGALYVLLRGGER